MVRVVVVAVLVSSLGLVVALRLRPLPADAAYVGSAKCSQCHGDVYLEWVNSQHNKMMRRVDQPGVVVADFASEADPPPLDRNEAVWAIGGKWEQQFMGHDGAGETLLPGAWLVSSQSWKATGWDGWEVPEPLRRCHGCHTVGLDVKKGSFTEPNIGCESCHGPGSWHASTSGLGAIHSSGDAQVCGQCHTRGKDVSGEFHFPVGYRPGADLSQYFVEESPSPPNNSSHWWGNGVERGRHQQFRVWKASGHAASLLALRDGYDGRYGAPTDECLGCHSGDYVLAGWRKPSVSEARFGITCSVCHQVHGELDQARKDCGSCHPTGAFYHAPERNAAHVPCPASAGVDCVSCHMPLTIENGGAFTMHSHSAGFIEPSVGAKFGSPSGCQNGTCHVGGDAIALQASFDRHYVVEEISSTSQAISK